MNNMYNNATTTNAHMHTCTHAHMHTCNKSFALHKGMRHMSPINKRDSHCSSITTLPLLLQHRNRLTTTRKRQYGPVLYSYLSLHLTSTCLLPLLPNPLAFVKTRGRPYLSSLLITQPLLLLLPLPLPLLQPPSLPLLLPQSLPLLLPPSLPLLLQLLCRGFTQTDSQKLCL